MRKVTVITFFLLSVLSFGQSLNDYNKAIVLAKFPFQKSDNQYRINATVKAFLNEKGIETYIENEKMPDGFQDIKCDKLYVDAQEENTMFVTKIKFLFKDCYGAVLFTTDLGQSREKEYAISYNLASIEALKTFDKSKYKYSGKISKSEMQDKSNANEVPNNTVPETKLVADKNDVFFKVIDKITNTEFVLYKTSKSGFYLTTFLGRNGVVFSKDNNWYFEYVDRDKVVTEKIDVKI